MRAVDEFDVFDELEYRLEKAPSCSERRRGRLLTPRHGGDRRPARNRRLAASIIFGPVWPIVERRQYRPCASVIRDTALRPRATHHIAISRVESASDRAKDRGLDGSVQGRASQFRRETDGHCEAWLRSALPRRTSAPRFSSWIAGSATEFRETWRFFRDRVTIIHRAFPAHAASSKCWKQWARRWIAFFDDDDFLWFHSAPELIDAAPGTQILFTKQRHVDPTGRIAAPLPLRSKNARLSPPQSIETCS
jgi:hypothetical protein